MWDLVQKGIWHGVHQLCDHQHYRWLSFGVFVWGGWCFLVGSGSVSQSFPLFGLLVTFIMLCTKTPTCSYSICCVTTCKDTLYDPIITL